MFTFIIRPDWEGSDVSRFSLANTILKLISTSILKILFSFVVWTVWFCMHAWRIFTVGSPAGTLVSVGSLGSASIVGRPETWRDPKNITDEAILRTFFYVCDYKKKVCVQILFTHS